MQTLRCFKNSKVIVTGHTGFKGSWLTAWLKLLGANVMGISLNVFVYNQLTTIFLETTLLSKNKDTK